MSAPAIVQADKLTLLELVNAATSEIGLQTYTMLIGNTDAQAKQILALAKREGKEFYGMAHRLGGWQELRQQHIFNLTPEVTGYTATTTEGSATLTNVSPTPFALVIVPPPVITGTGIPYDTRYSGLSGNDIVMDSLATETGTGVALSFLYDTYSLPDDFAYFMQQTEWDRSFRWQLLGPTTGQEWQVLKSGISPTGPRRRFRVAGNRIMIDPAPTETEALVFEYYSNAWCQSSIRDPQSTWEADDDYYSLDDDCFILGLQWRIKAKKGLDYTEEKEQYDMACERAIARNGGNRDLPLNARAQGINLLNSANVPDTGFGA
jgi:hypothetical protein